MCQHYSAKTTGHWYRYLQPHCGDTRWQCRYYMQLNVLIFDFCTGKFAGMLHTIKHAFMLSYTYILPSHTTCAHVHMHICTHIKIFAHTHFIVSSEDYMRVSMTLNTFTSQQPRQCFYISNNQCFKAWQRKSSKYSNNAATRYSILATTDRPWYRPQA